LIRIAEDRRVFNYNEHYIRHNELSIMDFAVCASDRRRYLFDRSFHSLTLFPAMSIARRLRQIRESHGLSLDDVATDANISKTYLWELEQDTAGEKRPSADVLVRIAAALSVTIADLLALPTTQVRDAAAELPPSLREFRERMKKLGSPLSDPDVRDLALTKFRGRQPQTSDEWLQLYLTLLAMAGKKRK
jgi:transcriptional regulator with XRE-family HTH domain